MDYRFLGRTGLRVSPLCLGTMNFGMPAQGGGFQTDEEEAFRIMDRGLELGINFFDTANVYGDGRGLTESIVGRWFAQGDRRREKSVIATKVYNTRSQWPNEGKLSALHIRQACEDSLRRMQTDHIDLYQMHHVDRDTPWDEIWQAMDLLVQQGKVLYVGSSNFAGWHIVKANEAAARRNSLGLVSEQSLYNLNARTVELEVLPACEDYGLGVIPWSPLGGGLLGGVLADRAAGGRRGNDRMHSQVEAKRTQLEAWEKLCAEIGAPPADVALAWLLHNPVVTAPIIGPRTVEQVDTAMGALDVELSDDVLAELDTIFPGPGGRAPEAYAW
ncbi:MAG TPA: aldo/keto reductase [Acidimicrobiia bacterium]|nr:aldo/keto reductase [Acidimicrobiia bacterium]